MGSPFLLFFVLLLKTSARMSHFYLQICILKSGVNCYFFWKVQYKKGSFIIKLVDFAL